MLAWPQALLTLLALAPGPAFAQSISQRGFVEGRLTLFPQDAPNDPTRAIGDFLLRDDVFLKPAPWLQLAGGLDLRADTHGQVDDEWRLDVADRGAKRPHLSVRRLVATMTHGGFTLDVGKQFIRWGKADIVNPTDRFAPRDFLSVFDNEFLAVTGARAVVETRGETFEAVWVPRFTPSRVPLLDQRWTAVPPEAAHIPIVDTGAALPRGSQAGVRWSHVGAGFESSLSFFNGFSHLPNVELRTGSATLQPTSNARLQPSDQDSPPIEIDVTRVYPAIRTYGGDAAVPTRWLTIKGEAAYVTSRRSSAPGSDEYVLFVLQLERQTGEWLLVGGYVGEAVTHRGASATFAPDRGVARSAVGRVSYTIDPSRSVAFEGAVRQTGNGAYAKVEYSQAHGQHWRATLAGVVIRGEPGDFLGQYRRNSHVALGLRYSF